MDTFHSMCNWHTSVNTKADFRGKSVRVKESWYSDRANSRSVIEWISRNFLLKAVVVSDIQVAANTQPINPTG